MLKNSGFSAKAESEGRRGVLDKSTASGSDLIQAGGDLVVKTEPCGTSFGEDNSPEKVEIFGPSLSCVELG